MMQHLLRKDCTHHILSIEKGSKGTVPYQFFILKSSYTDKNSKNDPKPRNYHTRKVTVTILIIGNVLTALFLCDNSYYYLDHHFCRHVHSMHDEMSTKEKFHPDLLLSYSQNDHKSKECADMVTHSMNLIRK